ncbi:PEP/pyruvate-binding domain-containing protein [Metallosphaera javensis (ex Sakai et al. 2022)]|uniref:PEP/pyruvate-binding domain-containing protein n=1 Tax=Metallosphaera javensis (ex Sakai et al. 2022) TaxID=2775498 RepID=UPI00258A01AB|nr:MAG: putative phosphoenolpyruvate synthase [Metallosphaera javensis (ex Sakai et al. 2022)]
MYVFTIDQSSSNMVRSVGRKAAYLGELTRMGIRVPWGFVITRSAFRRFMEINRNKISDVLRGANLEDPRDLERRYEMIKEIITQTEIPLDISLEIEHYSREISTDMVAVRPTITSSMSGPSFAGETETFLYVNKVDLPFYVKRAWASYFNPRSLAYRIAQGMPLEIAVLVQEMVDPESAGTAFTIHPVTGNPNWVIIESSWGLGQAVTRGLVTPDRFVLPKRDRVIAEKSIGHKHVMLKFDPRLGGIREIPLGGKALEPSLSDEKAIELANLSLRIEEFFGRHVNLEWALQDNRLYILEVRGVKTMWEEI